MRKTTPGNGRSALMINHTAHWPEADPEVPERLHRWRGKWLDSRWFRAWLPDDWQHTAAACSMDKDGIDRPPDESPADSAGQLALAAIDALPSPLCVLDENGRILTVNAAWRQFGRDNGAAHANAWVGENYLRICDDAVGPDAGQARAFAAGIRQVLGRAADEFTMEYPCHSPARQRWYLGKVTLAPGNRALRLVVAHEDISERKLAEIALRTQESQLSAVFDNAPVPMLVVDQDRRIRRANRAANELSAFSDEELIGVRGGDALRCIHALDDPRGCGFGPACGSCVIRRTVLDTLVRRNTHRRVEATLTTLADDSPITRHLTIATAPFTWAEQPMAVICIQDVTEYLDLLKELKESDLNYLQSVQYDALTALPNWLLFADRLNQALRGADRVRNRLAILFIDLDRFRDINNSFDHRHGDELLIAFARRLERLFRKDDTVARLSSDEFAVILPSVARAADAAALARKVLASFESPFALREHVVHMSASIGISVYPDDGNTPEELLRNADAAMHRAKRQGRGSYEYYTRDLTTRAFRKVLLASHLRAAVERNELILHYQPQFDLHNDRLSGIEALVRWQHPEMGLLSPAEFIPLAEETGLILPLGDWVLRHACTQAKQWRDAGLLSDDTLLAVNLSARQFERQDLVASVFGILRGTGLPPRLLELEITESTLMRAPRNAADILRRLRKHGIQVAIDDFGTGYSSLSYLKTLPFTKLKIDRSFVSDIPHSQNDVAIAKAIIALAHTLSLQVLAEGIENEEQRAFLTMEDCHCGQGYLYSRPLNALDLEQFLRAIHAR